MLNLCQYAVIFSAATNSSESNPLSWFRYRFFMKLRMFRNASVKA
jgi:hypothetical protein